MNFKMFQGILNASSEKRYNHFLTVAADSERVWMIDCGNDTLLSPEINGVVYFLVWAEEEFANYYLKNILNNDVYRSVEMEVHDFCLMLQNNDIKFLVFPNENDGWVVTSGELCQNLQYELARIELMD